MDKPNTPVASAPDLTSYRLQLVEATQIRTEGKVDLLVNEVSGLRADLRVLRLKVALVSAAVGAVAGRVFTWASEVVRNL